MPFTSSVNLTITGNRHRVASSLHILLLWSLRAVCELRGDEGEGSGKMAWYRRMAAFKLESLRGASNEGLIEQEDGVLVMQVGGPNGTLKRINSSTTGLRLNWLLSCGHHCGHWTPNNVRQAKDLLCPYCVADDDLKSAGKKHPSSHERAVWQYFKSKQMDVRLWPESQPPFWNGLIDFIDSVTGVLVQVDGEHHFAGRMYGESCMQRLSNDTRMCLAAWNAGCVLVRLHYMDVHNQSGLHLVERVIQAVADGSRGPMLVFSSHFDTTGTHISEARSLVGQVAKGLGAYAKRTSRLQSIWIIPDPMAGTSSP